MKIFIRFIINVAALLLLAQVFDGITISGVYAAIITTLILALLNAIIRPLLVILTLPITVLTLGLFVFVVNAFLFWFVASFVDGFDVAGFGTAFIGALFMSAVSWFTNAVLKESRE